MGATEVLFPVGLLAKPRIAKKMVSQALQVMKREVAAAKAALVRETIENAKPPDDGRPITLKAVWDGVQARARDD